MFFNVQGSILCNLHVFVNVQASIICNLHAFVTLQQRIFRFPGSFLGSFCAFGVPWGLLDSLGELKSLQAIFLIDFWPIWSHFGGPGADFGGPGLHFGGPGAPFWMPWASFLPTLGCDFYTPSLWAFPSLQTSKPLRLQASNRLGGNREAKTIN